MTKVVMVEIDQKVIDASKEHLPGIASSLNHPNLNLIVEDGIKYVNESGDESFDIVIVDSTDPVGPARGFIYGRILSGGLSNPNQRRYHGHTK